MRDISKCVTLAAVIGWLFSSASFSALPKNKFPLINPDSLQRSENAIQSQIAGGINYETGILDELSPYNYDTAGTSYYDLNANQRNVRQVAFVPNNRNVAAAWAESPNANLTIRNAYGALWKNSSKSGGNFLTHVPMHSDLIGYSGYPGFTYLPRSGKLVLYGHNAITPRGTYFSPESTPGYFDWGTSYHAPDSIPGDSLPGIWPSAAGGILMDVYDYDKDGNSNDTIEAIHFISTEWLFTTNAKHYIYSRAVDSMGTWIFPGFTGRIGMAVDSGMYTSPVVVTSKQSQKVALIWTAEHQCNYDKFCSDIYYLESTDGGQDWVDAGGFSGFAPVNITNCSAYDTVRATGDLMGVYDMNDSLVISFTEYQWYDPQTGEHSDATNIFVWSKEWGNRKAVDGNFYQMPPQVKFPKYTHTLNWPHIGVHDGTNYLSRLNHYYLVYTQYGGNQPEEYSDTADNGFLNGEIYIVTSTNRGKTWSGPVNLTNSRTPGCAKGNCSGISFSSCAEVVNDTVHIAYMSDLYAGSLAGQDQTSTDGTNNPAIYMKAPLVTDCSVGRISIMPGGAFEFLLNPDSALTDTFMVQNIGCADLIVDSIRIKGDTLDPGDSLDYWLIVDPTKTEGFTIIEGDPDVPIPFTVNSVFYEREIGGMIDTVFFMDGIYTDTILIYNNSSNLPVVKLVVRMIVDNLDPFYNAQFDVLSNGVVNINVSNVGNLGNQWDTSGFYRIIGSDTTNNLFDGTKFMAVILSNGDSVAGRWVFGQNYMQPLGNLEIKDTTLSSVLQKPGTKVKIPVGDYRYATATNATFIPKAIGVDFPGPWFGFKMTDEFWLPKLPNPAWHPAFLLWCQTVERDVPPSWWPDNPAYDSLTTTVYFGKALDWDVYGVGSPKNYGWPAWGAGAVWQEGSDSTWEGYYPNGHYAMIAYLDSLENVDPYSMHIVSNERYIYPTSGYDDTELYAIASDTSTYVLKYADSLSYAGYLGYEDYNSVMADLKLTPPYLTATVCNLVGVVGVDYEGFGSFNQGCDSLTAAYDSTRTALGLGKIDSLWKKLNCFVPDCLRAGDANGSGNYTLADVVSIVNYVFNKPGCAPQPICWVSGYLCRGDWNASGNVTLSDAIQAVNFIFNKPGGPWNPQPSGVCCL